MVVMVSCRGRHSYSRVISIWHLQPVCQLSQLWQFPALDACSHNDRVVKSVLCCTCYFQNGTLNTRPFNLYWYIACGRSCCPFAGQMWQQKGPWTALEASRDSHFSFVAQATLSVGSTTCAHIQQLCDSCIEP